MSLLAWAGWGVTAALAMLALVQAWNLRLFAAPVGNRAANPPEVSVCIPARDEERNIESCVRSLAGQSGVAEILVLDDDSSDGTAAIVEALARSAPNLRLLRGEPLPDGWRGKNWACQQLGLAARCNWVLFTDADTIHEAESVAAAAGHASAESLDLYSLMPAQIRGSFLERIALPLMNFFYLTFFPAFMLERSRDPKFSAANGQYLLFRRSAWEAIGGHASVRASIVDDLALARRIREAGLRLAVGDGQRLVSCRMYRSAREVIDGFTKNLHAAVGGRAATSAALALMLLALFTVPPLVAIFTREPSWIIATMLGIALRLRLSGRRDDSVASALAHPIAIALAVGVLLRSMMRPGIAWKGRTVG